MDASLLRAFIDVRSPLDPGRIIGTGWLSAEIRHGLMCGVDGIGLVLGLQHLHRATIGVELHLLELRRDIKEWLWPEMAEFPMIEPHMTERMMAALMRHEES